MKRIPPSELLEQKARKLAGEQVEECRGLLAREGEMFHRLPEVCKGE